MLDESTATSQLAKLFTRQAAWQSWLDVEAALARVQSRIGVIPEWAGAEISSAALLETIGEDQLRASIARTQAPVFSLTKLLAERAGRAGDFVHWGATTQNVSQTGRLLLMRQADTLLKHRLADLLEVLSGMAEDHAEALTVARTNRRHALPITFGFKVASWIEEIARNVDRLNDCGKRIYRLPFGGAVGAMHAWGDEGAAVYDGLAAELDLGKLIVPSRVVNDLFTDSVATLCLTGVAMERMARGLYGLMEEEIGEVAEIHSNGVVGSSTMPHKVNPKKVVRIIAECTRLRALAAPAMEAALPSHEGDAAANHLAVELVDEAYTLTWSVVDGLAGLLPNIAVHPQRMIENLKISGSDTASERLMMALAPHLGRARAHDLVHHALEDGSGDVASALALKPEISGLLSEEEVRDLLEPKNYVGQSGHIARQGAALGRATSQALRKS